MVIISGLKDTVYVNHVCSNEADNNSICEHAKRKGYAIITLDADFDEYSLLRGDITVYCLYEAQQQAKGRNSQSVG